MKYDALNTITLDEYDKVELAEQQMSTLVPMRNAMPSIDELRDQLPGVVRKHDTG